MRELLTIGIEQPAPALRQAAGDLPPAIPVMTESLFTTIRIGCYPTWQSLICSLLLHAAAVTGLSFVTFTVRADPPEVTRENGRPTELRIGDRLYYVAEVPASKPAGPGKFLRSPAAGSAVRAAVEVKAREAAPAPAPQPEPAQKLAALPRVFIPPEVKRKPESDQTLIQPASPPSIEPPADVRLPTLRIWTAQLQLPKPPAKQFVSPGQKKRDLSEVKPLAPQELEFAHALPAETNLKSTLVLPPTPALTYEVPKEPPKSSASAAPEGDPTNLLSLQRRPVPLPDTLIIPPGNLVGKTGDNADSKALGEGSGTATVPLKGTPDGKASTELRAAGLGGRNLQGSVAAAGWTMRPGGGTGGGTAVEGTIRSGQPGQGAGVAIAGTGNPGGTGGGKSGTGGGQGGTSSSGSGTASGSGRNGPGGNGDSNSGGRGTGSGTGSGTAAAANTYTGLADLVRIERPLTGNFDAVVVQSSPTDMFSESRGLLTGRPIYTVYLSAGSPKDWTLWFCLPKDASQTPVQSGNVVRLGDVPKVLAPYPTLMVVPPVTVGAGQRYLLVYGHITNDGKFDGLRIIRHGDQKSDELLLSGLSLWSFRPALRDGVPVMVEVLLSVPADRY